MLEETPNDSIFKEISTGIEARGDDWVDAYSNFLTEYFDDNPEVRYTFNKGISDVIRLSKILKFVR